MGGRLVWAIVAGFLAGVYLRSIAPLGLSFVLFLSLSAVATLLLSVVTRKSAQGVMFVAVLLACGAGILRMDAAILIPDLALVEKVGEELTLEGFIFNEPDVREASVRLAIKLESGTGILVIAPAHADISYGDRIRATGTLQFPSSFETGVGREFNYPAYLAKDGIGYELAFVREVEVVGQGSTNPLKAFAIRTKHLFLEGLGRVLPEPHAGLAGGITVGDKRGLGVELSDVFRTVGLVHIVVLSGYNIMIVMEGLSHVLGWFHASRYIRLGTTVFVAIFFALMTGLAAASVRAAAMAVIAVVGRVSGRMYLASRALAIVAAGMVLWNPYILAFDPGFQLSVLATAGLIAFTPIVITKLRFVPTKLGLREIAATTIGTQFAVLPFLLYQSGQLPLFSLPANLLALIAVPFAMLFSAIASLAGLALGPFAVVIAFPAYALLGYIVEVGNLLASLPYASVALPAFSAGWLAIIYAGMLLLVLYERSGKTRESV
ncbi:ComEC/Rec2 family competence protein [Candidatus Kaiserbacteria bacterium]|nr:ComEC/Rec2 family competence protein [Candidatus Kaiserbacteria bacterium]